MADNKYLDQAGAKIIADKVKAAQETADKKYLKPENGIPSTDLAQEVQDAVKKAGTALQTFTESDPTVSAWAKSTTKPTYTASEIQDLLGITGLENYYSKEDVDGKISTIPKFAISVVDSLPETEQSETTIYLLKSGTESQNLYTEYIWTKGAWEKLGEQKVDLSGYAKTADLPTAMTAEEVEALFTAED